MQKPYPYIVLAHAGCFMSTNYPRSFSISHPVSSEVNCPSFGAAYLQRKLFACLEGSSAEVIAQKKTFLALMGKLHEHAPQQADEDWFMWSSLHLALEGYVRRVLEGNPNVAHWEANHAHQWQTILLTYYTTNEGQKFFDDVIEETGRQELAYAFSDHAIGIGASYDDPQILTPETWTGENQYGKALQSFRDTLIKHPGAYRTDKKHQFPFD